ADRDPGARDGPIFHTRRPCVRPRCTAPGVLRDCPGRRPDAGIRQPRPAILRPRDGPRRVQNAVSLNSALMTGSRVVGPAVAGALVVSVGSGWCLRVDAVSYLAVVVALWMV